jgi:hypothetical protein
MAYVDNITLGAGDMLQFKCGTQDALGPYIVGLQGTYTNKDGQSIAGKQATDGTFYLTNDTSRLYVGNGGKAVPVNQGVISVATTDDLPKPGEPGQFYYVESGNILAVYAGSGNGWVQINTNTNTELKSYAKAVAAVNGGVKITDTITDTNNKPFSAEIEVVGGDGITVAATDADTITISAETSTLGTEASTDGGKIKLSGHDSGTVTIDVDMTASDNNVTSDENGNISIKLKDQTITDANFSANTGNGFNLALTKGSFGQVNSTTDLDPIISYDGNSVHFVNGTATLEVYDKASIDAKFEGFNAMHYIGTVGTGGSAGTGVTVSNENLSGSTVKKVSTITGPGAPSSYKIGDTFLVSSNITSENWSILAGSLLIAMGEEDTTTDTIKSDTLYFEVINESFEQDTTYTYGHEAVDNGGKVSLKSKKGANAQAVAGSMTVKGDGTHINGAIAGTAPNAVITLSHLGSAASQTDGGTTTVMSNDEFTVVDSVVEDGKGHVTAVNTKTIKMGNFVASVGSNSMTTSASDDKTTGTITHKVSVKTGSGGNSAEVDASFDLKSDTFTITDADTTNGNQGLKINMVWGSF